MEDDDDDGDDESEGRNVNGVRDDTRVISFPNPNSPFLPLPLYTHHHYYY